ncbi:MAG: hypothetical protein LUD78_07775 [Clostridiales bacterium]|nr:hypothetical protein [Clostridiales bacterium]
MNDVYEYIDFRNQIHSTFDNLRRIDQRDIPEVAVREALLNLLIHREYAVRASALVSIYADRIEFTSIGGLVSGETLNDVMMGISVCRNQKLANVFYRLELIEAYGTGIQKIMNAYEGTGVTPKIETSDNAFKIVLPNLNVRSSESVVSGKTNEEKVILLLHKQGTATRREMEQMLELRQTTCVRLLNKMLEDGQIVREGKTRIIAFRSKQSCDNAVWFVPHHCYRKEN